MDHITLLAIGIIIGVIGILYIKGVLRIKTIKGMKISDSKESEKFGKTAGVGVLIIGISFIMAYALSLISSKAMFYTVIIGVLIGLFFIAYARVRFTLNLYR